MCSQGPVRPIDWRRGRLRLLDQTQLPATERWLELQTVEAVAEAINEMRVRGAPAIGVAAAAGMATAAREALTSGADIKRALDAAERLLLATRPTAVNLRWGIARARLAVAGIDDAGQVVSALDRLVSRLLDEQWTTDRALAAVGAALLPGEARVLTHCNTGALATGGYGTALGVIRFAHERGKIAMVYVDESRPRLQGARLTAWELERIGAPYRVIPDSAAAAIMVRDGLHAILVGADRIAANGDTANKIGTYQLAIVAAHHRIPFYVVAPLSTIDPDSATGWDIPIEERSEEEVHQIGAQRVTPEGAGAVNLAFDVTPAELITGIVTEHGLLDPPYGAAIATLFRRDGPESRGGAGQAVDAR